VPSAYSLYDYVIAHDIGGPDAYQNLKDRAWARGIRMASDWCRTMSGSTRSGWSSTPDWFVSLDQNPYPWYTYGGPDLSEDERVGIFVEDHYYDRTDAAVTFRRVDRWTGREQYVYHGNDGTSMPWNDTAQLNYLHPDVREAVIQTILHVARQFPVIRFDAAMTLAKKHFQRLWFPEPGTGWGDPDPRRARPDPRAVQPGDAERVLARGGGPSSRSRRRTRCCWPRRSGCSKGTSCGRSGCTGSTTARS
jgi:hypothetical protein